jgi:signal transduction histidine kinase
LIDLTRMSRGTIRLNMQTCMPAETVHAALDTVQPAADARRVTIERSIDPTAGPVHADPDRLQQIAWNLAANAIKYTPEGGTIVVRFERADLGVRLIVRDTGRGIPPEFLPRAFDAFSQSSAGERAESGMGLGLAIVKHLVTLHGGTVEAASGGEGRGATFTVTLPLAGL